MLNLTVFISTPVNAREHHIVSDNQLLVFLIMVTKHCHHFYHLYI